MAWAAWLRRLSHILALTFCSLGLQVIWSILLSSGTPFFLSIGFDKSSTALIWSIAPICGTIIQPWLGTLSDRYRLRSRGRQIFLLVGALGTSLSLVGLSLSQDQVLWLAHALERSVPDRELVAWTQANSIMWFMLLNIAIQPLQMASRAIVIENNSVSDQGRASAWASRMQGIGSILGFLLGSIPRSSDTSKSIAADFSILSILGGVLLLTTTLISASAIDQDHNFAVRKPQTGEQDGADGSEKPASSFATIPRQVWQILVVQFFSWLGWFPFRTYYTSWLMNTYTTQTQRQSTTAEPDLQSQAAHLGSIVGLYLSIIAFAANCALPSITNLLETALNWNETIRPAWKVTSKIPTKAILLVWLASHIYFALAIFLAEVIQSQVGIIMIISSLGLSWAVTLWVPFCLIGLLISKENGERLNGGGFEDYHPPRMGAVLGLQNAAISAPQILSALICSSVFANSEDAAHGTMLSMLSGGCWALIAALALWIFFADLKHI